MSFQIVSLAVLSVYMWNCAILIFFPIIGSDSFLPDQAETAILYSDKSAASYCYSGNCLCLSY